jgi:hypothetical protein
VTAPPLVGRIGNPSYFDSVLQPLGWAIPCGGADPTLVIGKKIDGLMG